MDVSTNPGVPPWGYCAPSAAARFVIFLTRHTIFGRGALRQAMARMFDALHSGPVDVELWGNRVRLHPANNFVELKALLRPDVYDAKERCVVRSAVARQDAVFVDIGGNAGLYSLDAALHAGPGAKIIMIEPDSNLISRFRFNFDEARSAGLVTPRVDVSMCAVAVSDHDGEGLLASAGDEGARNIIGSGAGRSVRLQTLYSIVRQAGIDHIDGLKIDVEGHEDRALPPFFLAAPEALWPRTIIIEHLQRAQWRVDCIADMLQRGYCVRDTTHNNTILERS